MENKLSEVKDALNEISFSIDFNKNRKDFLQPHTARVAQRPEIKSTKFINQLKKVDNNPHVHTCGKKTKYFNFHPGSIP